MGRDRKCLYAKWFPREKKRGEEREGRDGEGLRETRRDLEWEARLSAGENGQEDGRERVREPNG